MECLGVRDNELFDRIVKNIDKATNNYVDITNSNK